MKTLLETPTLPSMTDRLIKYLFIGAIGCVYFSAVSVMVLIPEPLIFKIPVIMASTCLAGVGVLMAMKLK